jgi:hypothetical protein
VVASFQPTFGNIGGAIGGSGGSLLGILGSVLEPLDYPRQALWNLARSGANAVSGEGAWDDLFRAVPGALGAGLAGGLMATGVGAPLGILAGSALGGLTQGLGKAADSETFAAPTAQDITGTDEFVPNALVSMLGDPLTYAGGLGGFSKGRQMGTAFGGQLDDAARYVGPRYGGGAEKLKEAFTDLPGNLMPADKLASLEAHPWYKHVSSNPDLLNELAPGSKFVGAGFESHVFRNPETGGVTTFRASGHPAMMGENGIPLPRVNIPEMLPAQRSAGYMGTNADNTLMVEHAPWANVEAGGAKDWVAKNRAAKQMAYDMQQKGIDFWDAKPGNIGTDASGNMVVIDPGSVGGAGVPRFPDVRANVPPAWQQWLATRLGGPGMVRQNLIEQTMPLNVPR